MIFPMQTIENAQLLRVIVGEADRFEGRPLYEAIVLRARALGLAGATATRATMGFGASSHLHTTKILRLSLDLPMVIEIVDHADNIAKLLLEFGIRSDYLLCCKEGIGSLLSLELLIG